MMSTFLWILAAGLGMSLIALVGSLAFFMRPAALVHGGWSRVRALRFNFASALTFLAGGLVAYAAASQIDVGFVVPFAAGNFLYIGASDLVPEVNKHHSLRHNVIHFAAFVLGRVLLFAVRRGAGT